MTGGRLIFSSSNTHLQHNPSPASRHAMAMKLLTILTLALAVAANPIVVRKSPVTLPVARRFNFTGSANIREIDQARAKTLKSRTRTNPKDVSKASLVNVPVTNTVVTYTAEVNTALVLIIHLSDGRDCRCKSETPRGPVSTLPA